MGQFSRTENIINLAERRGRSNSNSDTCKTISIKITQPRARKRTTNYKILSQWAWLTNLLCLACSFPTQLAVGLDIREPAGSQSIHHRRSLEWPHAAQDRAGNYVWLERPSVGSSQFDLHRQSDDMSHMSRSARELGVQQSNFYQSPESLMLYQSPNRNTEAEVETIYIRKGANGTLPCLSVSPADQQATMNKIEWFKEDKRLVESEARRLVAWHTKHTIAYLPETGALLFRGVANEDSGEYHCVLTKLATGESEDGIVRFYVQDVPEPTSMPVVTGFTQRSVNLSWVPSFNYHHSPILHYIIHVREGVDGPWDEANGFMTPDNRTQFEIIGLKPFTAYSFRVLPVNAIGVGPPSPNSHYTMTLRQRPDSLLNIVNARNISSSSIKLEWLQPSPNEIHGEFLGYRIRYVQQFHEHSPPMSTPPSANESLASSFFSGFGQQSSSSSSNKSNRQHQQQPVQQPSLDGPLAREVIVSDPKQTSYVIRQLNTFTLYKISLQVMNPAGDGPVAEALAMTDEGVPSPPTNVEVLKATDTTFRLRWLEPKAPNGILQGYQIVLHDLSLNSNETRHLSELQPTIEYTIAELTPHTWFKFYVQAVSRRFLGEPSQMLKYRTDVSSPSQPHGVNVTCYSHDSILIQWSRPEKFYSQIDFYYVQYKPDSIWQYEETTLLAKKDKLLNELLITNLTAGLLYELKVVAGTRSIYNQDLVYKSEPSATYRVVLQENCESK